MCPSEVSDIEDSVWRAWADEGVVVWGVTVEEEVETVREFRDVYGLTFPILVDPGGTFKIDWSMKPDVQTAPFPQNWIVAPDGTIAYSNNHYEPGEVAEVLDRLLP